jgi:hypothetical protein
MAWEGLTISVGLDFSTGLETLTSAGDDEPARTGFVFYHKGLPTEPRPRLPESTSHLFFALTLVVR